MQPRTCSGSGERYPCGTVLTDPFANFCPDCIESINSFSEQARADIKRAEEGRLDFNQTTATDHEIRLHKKARDRINTQYDT